MLVTLLYFLVIVCLVSFVVTRLTIGYTKGSACLVGKTAIVTGGNSGIGYEVSLALATRGCRVIIADRDDAEASKERIIKETGNKNVVAKHLDLASYKSVREFADDINRTEKSLHILLNNAGVGALPELHTEDGVNAVFQVNHYGGFLLTHLLVDLLKKSAPSRIVFTSSILAFQHNLTEENMNPINYNPTSTYASTNVYSNTKFCCLVVANEFAKRLERFGVTCNSLHPGTVRTNIFIRSIKRGRLQDEILLYIGRIFNYITGKNAWEGAQTSIHLTASNDVEKITGKHFWDCKVFPFLPPKANNKNICKMVWQKSEEYSRLKESEKIKE
ncbi:unnamed protein product [Brassicogethes aeneus]|uniref:Uncharacterized protein n=1 Tax=Brassicogethes aeneus TaxID=1431903 RepID=A0A9P0B3P8_BRAAE|nr:unnamed protein product [Brassicogethes aeneus]